MIRKITLILLLVAQPSMARTGSSLSHGQVLSLGRAFFTQMAAPSGGKTSIQIHSDFLKNSLGLLKIDNSTFNFLTGIDANIHSREAVISGHWHF